MTGSDQTTTDHMVFRRALETTIRLGLIALLLVWCFHIVAPFVQIIVWGIIIAVAMYPVYARLLSMLDGKRGLAASLVTILLLVVIIVPTAMLAESAIENAKTLSEDLKDGSLTVPPPRENVAQWPIIGEQLYKYWSAASSNLEGALAKLEPQLKDLGKKMLKVGAAATFTILQFVISVLIAGTLLAKSVGAAASGRRIAVRFGGERGDKMFDLVNATIRSVAQGVLGIALIQTILAAVGMLLVGVPGAPFWSLLVLILAIVQLPPVLIIGPIIVYVFSASSTGVAVAFMIYGIVVSMSDTFLKPLLLGRGVEIPMLVILLGAIGGMMLSGVIGLFVGAVVLAIGYKLFVDWLNEEPTGKDRERGRTQLTG